jgi:RND family efflux transporter MFP subunit
MALRTSRLDDRPRLTDGAALERGQAGLFVCRDPKTGAVHSLRKLEALVAQACDGARTVPELQELAQRAGSNATVDMVADVVRRLAGLGLLELSGGEVTRTSVSRPAISVEFPAVAISQEGGVDRAAAVAPPAFGEESPQHSMLVPMESPPESPLNARPSFPDGLGGARTPTPAPAPSAELPPVSSVMDERLKALASLSLSRGPEALPSAGIKVGQLLPWVLLLALAGGGGLYLWREKTVASVQTDAPRLRTLVVQPEVREGRSLLASGYVVAPRTVQVGTEQGGQVKSVKVESGEAVKRGQVLVLLDDAQPRAELALAQARVRNAGRTLRRTQMLYKAEAATSAELDKALGDLDIARAEILPIKNRLDATKIRAPMDGTVIEVIVKVGEIIRAADSTTGALLKIADLNELKAEVDMNETDVLLVRPRQKAEVTSEAAQGKTYEGEVREIVQEADRARGTVKVKVDIIAPDEKLRPGMSARVAFLPDNEAPPRLLIPRGAVIAGNVWVVTAEGVAGRRPVTFQAVGPSMVEVTEGLEPGERIVLEPGDLVTEGMRIP